MEPNSIAPSLERLTEQFRTLPGIGRKTAMRLALSMVTRPVEKAEEFANSIIEARRNIGYCRVCQSLCEGEICSVCADESRDHGQICVVEDVRAVISFEKVREYRGVYHVLHGTLSPLNGIGPEQLRIDELVKRVSGGDIREVIIATNPTVEGEATAAFITKILKKDGNVKVSRLACGMPVGGDLEFADAVTLFRAFEGRTEA